jgi:hypothetical protein
MQACCSGQRPTVTTNSVLPVLGLLRPLPSKSSPVSGTGEQLGSLQRRWRRFRFYMQSLCPRHRASGSLSRGRKKRSRVSRFASQNLGAVNVFYSRQVKSSGYSLASQKLPKKCQQTNQRSDGSCLPLLPAHTVSCSRFPVNSGSLEW